MPLQTQRITLPKSDKANPPYSLPYFFLNTHGTTNYTRRRPCAAWPPFSNPVYCKITDFENFTKGFLSIVAFKLFVSCSTRAESLPARPPPAECWGLAPRSPPYP